MYAERLIICAYLNIHTPTILSSELKIEGAKTERLIKLLRAVDGTTFAGMTV